MASGGFGAGPEVAGQEPGVETLHEGFQEWDTGNEDAGVDVGEGYEDWFAVVEGFV